MSAAANILLCAGVLLLAIQWENYSKPPVVERVVAAAKIQQRLVHVIEIGPDEPPKNYVLMEDVK